MSWLHACYISFCTLMNYKKLCSSSKTAITNAIDTLKSTGIQKKSELLSGSLCQIVLVKYACNYSGTINFLYQL